MLFIMFFFRSGRPIMKMSLLGGPVRRPFAGFDRGLLNVPADREYQTDIRRRHPRLAGAEAEHKDDTHVLITRWKQHEPNEASKRAKSRSCWWKKIIIIFF